MAKHWNGAHRKSLRDHRRRSNGRRSHIEPLEKRNLLAVIFSDSFESGQWAGNWVEDSQNDWFTSSQRSTRGSNSAEVDGRANDATLTLADPIDLTGFTSAQLTFDWLIESGFGSGESLALDISTDGSATWVENVLRLEGDVSQENTWHSETVDLTPYASAGVLVRFRANVSRSNKDANIDNVKITGASPVVIDPALPVKVFLLAGHSNVLGVGRTESLDSSWNVAQEDVWIWLDHNMDGIGDWVTSEPGHGGPTHAPHPDEPEGITPGHSDGYLKVGPELGLGRTLADAYPEHRIALIKHARGGGTIGSDWNPENIGPPESADHMWSGLLQKTSDALEALEAAGSIYEVSGMFLALGARDAKNWNFESADSADVAVGEEEALARSAVYGEKLSSFIDAVREEFPAELPFIQQVIRTDLAPVVYEQFPGAFIVRDNQLDVGASVPWVANAEAEGISLRDLIHFDAMGQIEYGTRLANSYLDLVAATDLPPVAVDDAYSTAEDTVLNVGAPGVLDGDADPKDDPLTAVLVSDPTHGAVTLNANGSFTYTPDANYTGSDSFTYRAHNGTSLSNLATVDVTVDPVNDAPQANDQTVSVTENTNTSITLSASDIEGGSLTYSVLTGPMSGSLSGTSPNLVYTPGAGFVGTDSFTFVADDGELDSNVATVTIDVSENQVPSADAGVDRIVFDGDGNGSESVTLIGSGFDPDGTVVSFEWNDGTTTVGNTASISPVLNVGTHTLTLTVTDDAGATNSDTVVVTVSEALETMRVGDLDGSVTNLGKNWRANVTVTVLDSLGDPVPNATVEFEWTGGFRDAGSGVSDANGHVAVSSGNIRKNRDSTTLTVTAITHGTLSYAPEENTDPDGDSNGTAITVFKDGTTFAAQLVRGDEGNTVVMILESDSATETTALETEDGQDDASVELISRPSDTRPRPQPTTAIGDSAIRLRALEEVFRDELEEAFLEQMLSESLM